MEKQIITKENELPVSADFYRSFARRVVDERAEEVTERILPEIYSLIKEAASKGDFTLRIDQTHKLFKLIGQSNVTQILRKNGFAANYDTVCRDESIYKISWQ